MRDPLQAPSQREAPDGPEWAVRPPVGLMAVEGTRRRHPCQTRLESTFEALSPGVRPISLHFF